MTDNIPDPSIGPTEQPRSSTTEWDLLLERLRARYPKANESVLFCINALQQGGFADPDDIKARAQMHGLHVTGASLAAAKRHLAPPPAPRQPAPSPTVELGLQLPGPAPAEPAPTRKPRESKPEPQQEDLEQKIRGAFENLTRTADKKTARMRKAVAEAVRLLRDALD